METKKKFVAPEVQIMNMVTEGMIAMSVIIGGDGGTITQNLSSATFNWSNGKIG